MNRTFPSLALLTLVASFISMCAPARGQSNSPFPPEKLVIVRSQPSVFMALASGDGELSSPKTVSIKLPELEKEFGQQRDASKTAFFWKRVTTDPGSYLTASPAREIRRFTDQIYASGTAFAVSREGVLLTNAHVIADPDTATLSAVVGELDLLKEPLERVFRELVESFGGTPAAEQQAVAGQSISRWFATQCSVSGKFKRAYIALRFGTSQEKLNASLLALKKSGDLKAALALSKPAPILRPAEILAVGQPFPGKDVAVLRLLMEPQDAPSSGAAGASAAADRLICLPLGDSDAVLPGASIHALGFPGKAFSAEVMDPEAQFRVSSQSGEIGQTKRTTKGWEAFEMSAEVDHGDSGGPVVDARGNVIGLTVWGNLTGHKLAVPINVAKEFLKQAGVRLDVGPLSRAWDEGLRLYDAGQYAGAAAKFKEVRDLQSGGPPPSMAKTLPGFSLLSSTLLHASAFQNPYVNVMWANCMKLQQPQK